jgi:hypothetical protein
MKQITRDIVAAFMKHEPRRIGNSRTDGTTLYLHGNAIAEWRMDGSLWITSAGWRTNTTKERLNGIPGVRIHQKDYTWYLNGEPWNGDWVRINRW